MGYENVPPQEGSKIEKQPESIAELLKETDQQFIQQIQAKLDARARYERVMEQAGSPWTEDEKKLVEQSNLKYVEILRILKRD
jgi:hypothetical protein